MLYESFSIAINPYSRSHELNVLFSGHSQTEPLHEVGPQVLDYYLIHYIVSGKGIFECMGQNFELKSGHCFTIFPGTLVKYVSDPQDPWKYRWVAFKGALSNDLLSRANIKPEHPCTTVQNKHHHTYLFSQVQRILKTGDPACDLKAEAYLRLIIAENVQSQINPLHKERISEARQQVDKAVRLLSLQYSRPLSMEEMAHHLGYHRTHLSKIFKKETGLSPMNYLLKIRMERASHLILHDSLTIQQIASSVGYSDPLYFSKQFKKWFGLSPTQYRERRN